MDHHRKTKVVSGYATLKAAQRSAELAKSKNASKEPSEVPVKNPATEDSVPKLGSHIGHTAMPTKLNVVCYACGYGFKITGRTPSTHCPKCRTVVDLSDHTIDSTWTGSVRTGGKIMITSKAVIISGELVGADIRLEGEIRGGKLKATRELQLGHGAVFSPSCFDSSTIRILPDAVISFRGKMDYPTVIVEGTLSARSLHCSEKVRIEPGGWFKGELLAEHVEISEGGGLTGQCKIGDLGQLDEDHQPTLLKKLA